MFSFGNNWLHIIIHSVDYMCIWNWEDGDWSKSLLYKFRPPLYLLFATCYLLLIQNAPGKLNLTMQIIDWKLTKGSWHFEQWFQIGNLRRGIFSKLICVVSYTRGSRFVTLRCRIYRGHRITNLVQSNRKSNKLMNLLS